MTNRPRVLITGASGLLAHEFISRYQDSFDIFAVTHSKVIHPSANIRFLEIDFCKDWDIKYLPREVEYIVHLAQSSRFRDFPGSALEVFNVNLLSTMKLLDYAIHAKVRKFVLASTGGIYGSSVSPISTNSEILSPTGLSHYFGSKLAAEIFANNYRDFYAIDINRIFFMYGPRQPKAMLIPRLIDSVITGKSIQLAGPNGIFLNPVYVSDVASFLSIQLADSDSHVYNVAGPETISMRNLVGQIESGVGKSAKFEMLPPAANIIADATDFLSKLGVQAVSISEGIERCLLESQS